ncbi:MAG: MarR family transcriptional regulator, partial [Mesorhizobium sp.]
MIEVKSSSTKREEMTWDVGLAVMRWQDATQAYD